MYLYNILQKDKNEIVHRVYEAQKSDPNPGDFVLLVKEDCEAIGLTMSEKEIERMPKLRFKKIVRTKCVQAGGLYTDKSCPLGCGETDTLPNILTCKVLKQHHVSIDISSSDIRYEDIFSSDILKQKQVAEL